MENRKGLPIAVRSGGRGVAVPRTRPRRSMRQQPLGEKDLSTQRVGGPCSPPQLYSNLPITRKTRFQIAYSGAAVAFAISATQISQNDANDYFGASTPIRFNSLHLVKAEAWFGTINDPTSGAYPILELFDSVSNTSFTDTPNGGVDWAHVAIRPCLYSRMTERPASDTAGLISVIVAAAEGCTGNIVVDVTFTAQ